jgi:hypothetical protein
MVRNKIVNIDEARVRAADKDKFSVAAVSGAAQR